MSVSRLRKEQRHTWLTVDAATVRLIRHADALAVWILLLNSPDDWIVRRAWLQKELGIGAIRLRSAIARLEGLGLWERRPLRNAQGHLCGTEIVIREIPALPPSVQVPRHSVILEARETSIVGKTTPYQETKEVPKNESNTKPVAAGGGKTRPSRPEVGKLSLVREFGLAWSKSHEHLLPESRAVAILRHEGIEDAGQARRIIAEWAAMAARSSDFDAAAVLVWACRNHLMATAAGDQHLPAWS
jgi:hypothetical protein